MSTCEEKTTIKPQRRLLRFPCHNKTRLSLNKGLMGILLPWRAALDEYQRHTARSQDLSGGPEDPGNFKLKFASRNENLMDPCFNTYHVINNNAVKPRDVPRNLKNIRSRLFSSKCM